MQRLSLVSLFSGCGGLDMGLSRAGFYSLVSTDNSHDCCNSLRYNHLGSNVIERDIRDLPSAEILSVTGLQRGELDLVAGGPPCPPYSKSRFYRKEKPRALEDPAAITLHEYLRVVADLEPRAFLMENVPGLAYKVHRDALNFVIQNAEELGYVVQYQILNAADYGVPQRRERLFIVGTRPEIKFAFPESTHRERRAQQLQLLNKDPWVTAGEAIGDLDTIENASDDGHFAGGQYHHLLELVPPGDNYLFFTAKRGYPNPIFQWRSRYWSFLLKLDPNQPSWTIQARRSNNMGPFHWRNRILRIEEVKRLQTFPDELALCGTVESQWRQIGNAVPPRLSEALGRSLFEALTYSERRVADD